MSIETIREALEASKHLADRLSRLGNEPYDGNSIGNCIAQELREKLFTIDLESIRAEARAEGAKAFKRMMLDASRPIVWPLIEGIWGVFCSKEGIEPGAILADEPKTEKGE